MAKENKKDTETPIAAPIILVDGDKGGVGKSVVAGSLVDWIFGKGRSVAVVDGDARNADVGRLFDDLLPVKQADLRVHDGWMDVTDFVYGQPADRTVVISMPAGIGGELKREADRFADMAKQLARPIMLLWVINRTPDSVILLREALDSIGGHLAHRVVFKNLFFGEPEKFRRWDGSETRKEFERSGGTVLGFPELHERVMDKLFADPSRMMPYSAAAVPVAQFATSQHGLTASECIELNTWLKEISVVFADATAALDILPK